MYSCSLREYECLDVLRQCTALEECSISTSSRSTPFHDLQRVQALPRHTIVLPSLHTLRLRLSDSPGHDIFVRTLRLPCLRRLGVESRVSLPRILLPAFRTLLSKTIRYLDFSSWTPTDLPSVLVLVPNLQTLKLWDCDIKVLQMLGRGAAPRLITLGFGRVVFWYLLDMLEARVDAARSDRNIVVPNDVSAAGPDAWDIEIGKTRLAALRTTGVQIAYRGRLL
ncbi:hypothetical protein BD779DRAFT_1547163 [Infundibulicybe gibba]|nr:hypothetical protein BD779DRAFT_1547163 [Infundibulicybe gibba]